MKIKRIVISVAAAGAALSAVSQTSIISIKDWEKSRPNWDKDSTEVAYLITRCGALLSTVGTFFATNNARPEDKVNGAGMQSRGMALTVLGLTLSSEAGMGPSAQEQRLSALTRSYSDLLAVNKARENNIFAGFVYQDFQYCLDVEKAVTPK